MTVFKIEIPGTIEECARLLLDLHNTEQKARFMIWIIIHKSSELIIDRTSWLEWVKENYPGFQSDSHIDHLRRIGEFLVSKQDSDHFDILSHLHYGKLLSLSRLDNKFDDFMGNHDVAAMNRDEVISAVNEALGENKKKKKPRPANGFNPNSLIGTGEMYQPDMFDIINQVASWDEAVTAEAAIDSRLDVWTPARSGLSLIDVAIRKIENGDFIDDEKFAALIETLEEDIRQLKSSRN